MIRRNALLALGTILVAGALAGCTSFAPVYGDTSPTGLASARFNFAPPTNRVEQIILQRLEIAFPGPASASDPTLRVSASTSGLSGPLSDAIVVGDPVGSRVEATVTITSATAALFTATRFTDTSYQSGRLTPNDRESLTGAQETAAASTAEALRAAILAGYRPGAAPQ